MALLINANVYKAEEFKQILSYVERWKGQMRMEAFPMPRRRAFASFLEEGMDVLKHVPISFRSPYYKAEHSIPQGTQECEYTTELMGQTPHYLGRLSSRYMVFHHNNCAVRDEERMLRDPCINYRRVEELFRPPEIPVTMENTGAMGRGSMLLGGGDFVSLCQAEGYPALIDIGYVHVNGWDLCSTMERLKRQILIHHLHNNDGAHNSRRRVGDGTLDFDSFTAWAGEYTPQTDPAVERGMGTADDYLEVEADVGRLLGI